MLKSIRQLDYVILLCDDIRKMRGFYHGIMGFPICGERADWIELRVGSILLGLRPRGRQHDGSLPAPDSASVQLAFRVSPPEVDGCHQELVRKGVAILDPPANQVWGHRTLFFRDPENNILEIYAAIR